MGREVGCGDVQRISATSRLYNLRSFYLSREDVKRSWVLSGISIEQEGIFVYRHLVAYHEGPVKNLEIQKKNSGLDFPYFENQYLFPT